MAQSMLPFPDTPLDQTRPPRLLKRSPGPARGSAKPLDHRLATALADPSRVVFLDVETTGLSWFYDELTIVGWLCGGNYDLHITGDDPAPLIQILRSAHTLVTFNGTLFDL